MNFAKFSTLILFTLFISFASCNKGNNDETQGVKLLTGKTKHVIGESHITYNMTQYPIVNFEISTENGENTILMFLNELDFVAVSFTGEQLDWMTILASIGGDFYFGENFEATTISSNTISGSGILENQSGIELPMTILFDQTSIGAGESTIEVVGTQAKINGTLGAVTYNLSLIHI